MKPQLPGGGGTLKGTDASISDLDHAGEFSFTIPLPISPCRGFEPPLALVHRSGGGHGAFGLGFSLALDTIRRRTSKGFPAYDGSDVFVWQEQPLVRCGAPVRRVFRGKEYSVTRLRPRLDHSFARVELFEGQDHTFWRILETSNVTHLLGYTASARVAAPDDPGKVFEWLLEESTDAKGDSIHYSYKADGAQPQLERVIYGEGHLELVFDYGEYDSSPGNDRPYRPVREWPERLDAGRSFESGFERVQRRLCRGVLMFHRFAELGAEPVLVKLLRLGYEESPHVSTLVRAEMIGSRLEGARYEQQALPPLVLGYAPFQPQGTPAERLAGDLPAGGGLLDLKGEGLPGFFLGPAEGGPLYYPPRKDGYGPQERPAWPLDGAVIRLHDVAGHCRLDAMRAAAPAGWYPAQAGGGFAGFRPFASFPSDAGAAGMEMVDLSGAGLADLTVIGQDAVVFYPSRGEAGYGPARSATRAHALPTTMDPGPACFQAFAPFFGTGGQHRLRVTRASVEVWPHLGHGRFGDRRVVPGLPDLGQDFDAARVRLADIDGSGTPDLAYVRGDRVEIYRNLCGAAFDPVPVKVPLPAPCWSPHQVEFCDVRGQGCDCLVFTEVPAAGERPRRWLWDFGRGRKPYMLETIDTGTGGRTTIRYESSVRSYLEGGWSEPLPFPVQVVASIEHVDEIAGLRTVSAYAYRHGRYDPVEREFCGFGRVDRSDSDAAGEATVIRTWYHTGAGDERERFASEFYREDKAAWQPAPDLLRCPADLRRQACFALRGLPLREEVFGPDSPDAYGVTEHSYCARLEQPASPGGDAVFSTHASEELDYDYERRPADPKIHHSLVLEVDDWGRILRSCDAAYPRRTGVQDLLDEQKVARLVCQEAVYEPAVSQDDALLAGLLREQRRTELPQPPPGRLSPDGLGTWLDANRGQAKLLSWHRHHHVGAKGGETPAEPPALQGLLRRVESARFSAEEAARLFAALPLDGGLERFLRERGGYVLDAGWWWSPGMVVTYDSALFHLPSSVRGPFGCETTHGYDACGILLARTSCRTTDVQETSESATGFDYQVLAPCALQDDNGLVHEVRFDALGRVIATSHGKPGTEDGFAPLSSWQRPPAMTLEQALEAPAACLQGAASFHLYEPLARPPRTLTLSAEHYSGSPIGIAVIHQDAAGRVAQALKRLDDGRWLSSGTVEYDGKGRPARLYEPFFAASPAYAPQRKGPVVRRRYDAVGRVVRVDLPWGNLEEGALYEKQEFTAWSRTLHDANDTVLDSALYAQRSGAEPLQCEALEKAAAHDGTPTVLLLDNLGHTVRQDTQATKGVVLSARRAVDVDGRELWSADPRLARAGKRSFERAWDLEGAQLRSWSADAGEQLTLEDCLGRVLLGRDARGWLILHSYDGVGRPVQIRVIGDGTDRVAERLIYADSLDASGQPAVPSAEASNLRGQVVRHYDGAGLAVTRACDPYGGPLSTVTRARAAFKEEADWKASGGSWSDVFRQLDAALEAEEHASSGRRDALGRFILHVDPAGRRHERTYLLSGAVAADIVDGRCYRRFESHDARGRPLEITFGNGAKIIHEYEPGTALLKRLRCVREGTVLADLTYWYDPMGNVASMVDTLAPEGGSAYRYDALYRLLEASGRARAGRQEGDDRLGAAGSFARGPLERYVQTFEYDCGSNLRKTTYSSSSVSWMRQVSVAGDSNRPADLPLDASGNVLDLGGLPLAWDYADNLRTAAVPGGVEYYVYDSEGQRARKVFEGADGRVEDCLYLGDVERLRVSVAGGPAEESWRILIADGAVERIERPASAQDRYQVVDRLGSRILELDASGGVLAREEYSPYGGTTLVEGDPQEASARERRHAGEPRDLRTGLYYYGRRYYAPWLGRWLSPDPAGDADGLNLYLFAGGNPVSSRDFGGLGRVILLRKAKNGPQGSVAKIKQQSVNVNVNRTKNLLKGRSVKPDPLNPTAAANALDLKALVGSRKARHLMKNRWKGPRDASGKTTGIRVYVTSRMHKSWTKSHRAAAQAAAAKISALPGYQGLSNGKTVWYVENSHLVAASLYGPNDILSAPPASVHQNTEWLAIEEGLKKLVKNNPALDVRFKVTGYYDTALRANPVLYMARFKIYVNKQLVFNHYSNGARNNIDENESEDLKQKVVNLHNAAPLPGTHKGVSATLDPPAEAAMQAGHLSSVGHPAHTDLMDVDGKTVYVGQKAMDRMQELYS